MESIKQKLAHETNMHITHELIFDFIGAGEQKGEAGVALVDVDKGFERLGVMLSKEELAVWFAGCDENGDGLMSLNEFHAAAEKQAQKERWEWGLVVSASEKEVAIEKLRETARQFKWSSNSNKGDDDDDDDDGDGDNEKEDVALDTQLHYRQTSAILRLPSLSQKPAAAGNGGSGGNDTGGAVFRGGGLGNKALSPRALPGAKSSQGILSQLQAHKQHNNHYVKIHDRGSVGRIFHMINELYEGLYQHEQLVESAMCSLVIARYGL